VLSRNEIARDYAYNRKIFLRVRRGYYVLSPNLSVKVGENWENIYHLMGVNIKEISLLPPLTSRSTVAELVTVEQEVEGVR